MSLISCTSKITDHTSTLEPEIAHKASGSISFTTARLKLLLDEALTLGCFETKEDTVVTALREFINRRKQQKIIKLF